MNIKKILKKEVSLMDGSLILGTVSIFLAFITLFIFFLIRQHDLSVSPYSVPDAHVFRMNSIATFEIGMLISKTFFFITCVGYASYFLQKMAHTH